MALAKAQITVEHTGERLQVMFNPEEYTLNKDNNFASQSIPGLSSPLLQFVNGNLRTLEMELFFDTYLPITTQGSSPRDVRDETEKIIKLMKIDSELHAPPILRFTWASLEFRCVLARVSQKFQMFLDDGRPVRAKLTCTFNEFIDEEREAKEVNRQTADFSKAHAVIEGETLANIAFAFYGNPELWRPIAIANKLIDPRSIDVGRLLVIPSLPFTDPETEEVTV
ncbi:MAG: peptigoglycan-binding protein LysM [Blastocatellia bacterium AA13]|nr:MAG: peptigoglycan-binding protein LysM [Blastocatellia bacterium AA13]